MSFSTLRSRDESTTSIQPQGQYLSSKCSIIRDCNAYFGGEQMLIQQSHLLEPSAKSRLPSNCSSLSDCLKAQMMLHLPGLPFWNLSNILVGKSGRLLYTLIYPSHGNAATKLPFFVLSVFLTLLGSSFSGHCFIIRMTNLRSH